MQEADLIAAAFAITAARSRYIQFTKSYIDVGYSLLRHRDKEESTDIWAFLNPFDLSTKVVLVMTFVFLWVAFLIVQKVSPYANSSRLQTESDPKTALDVAENSIWLFFATAMQQGSEDIRAISGKLMVAGWFFFCLVIVSTYTANLAAFLTVKSFQNGINSLDDLVGQTEIVYGTVRDTSVAEFFSKSPIEVYRRMHTFITNTEGALTETAEEAIRRVEDQTRGEYVFIWDRPILDYIASRRPCNTEVVGREFHSHGYALAMPLGMPYESNFSLSILKMRESGFMEQVINKWLDGLECSSAVGVNELTDASEVRLTDLIGVFLILAATTIGSFALAFLERVWWLRNKCRTHAIGNKVKSRML